MNRETTLSHEEVIQEHYRRLGADYDAFLLYSPHFVRTLTSKMIEMLELREDDRLVDLGAGTGIYTFDILEQRPLRAPVVAVEPFEEMVRQMPRSSRVEPIVQDAQSFARESREYSKVLMKEMVHHVDDKEGLFSNLREHLVGNGRMLLVHVPPRLDYPLFRRALERCEKWHADPDALVRILEQGGFEVRRDAIDYPHAIPRDHYFRMVRGQYMSVLSSFSSDEIEEGIAEMASKYADRETLVFNDHFDYILATKR